MNEYHLFDEKEEISLLAAFAWWEKRRLTYNLLVGATGIICLVVLSLFPFLGLTDFIGIIIYGIIANLFYSCGFLVEIASRHYLKSKTDFTEKRKAFFGIGLVLSILVTIVLSFGYAFMLSAPF